MGRRREPLAARDIIITSIGSYRWRTCKTGFILYDVSKHPVGLSCLFCHKKMAQKTKPVDYNCNNYCGICDVEVLGKVKLGNYNIFIGKKAKDAQIAERLAKILECDLQQSNCSSIIYIKCYRTVEKLKKAKEILTKELPNHI